MRSHRSALLVVYVMAALAFGVYASASDASPLPGRLIVTRVALYGCEPECEGPTGWLDLRTAGPGWRFAPPGRRRFPTPFLPQISPDGRWMLFGDDQQRLLVQQTRRPGGPLIGAPTVVPGVDYSGTGTAASWGPDSAHIVIAGWVNGERGVWIVDRNGLNRRRIVDDTWVEVEADVDKHAIPAWSAKGGIAFVGSPVQHADGYLWAIHVVAPDGSGLRSVTSPVRDPVRGRFYGVLDSAPSWSPDGRRLVYAHDVFEEGSGALRSVTLATGRVRTLRRAGASPVFSPGMDAPSHSSRPTLSNGPFSLLVSSRARAARNV